MLRLPELKSIKGRIIDVKTLDSTLYEKYNFKKDTIIVVLLHFDDSLCSKIYCTTAQWKAFQLDSIMFKDNVVNVTTQECIAGVTGYKKEKNDIELIPHHQSCDTLFASVVNISTAEMLGIFSSSGIGDDLVLKLYRHTNAQRAKHNQV